MVRWIAEIKDVGLDAAAGLLGMVARGRGGWSPCPKCGAQNRSREERRPAVGSNPKGGWECHAGGCEASGDAADLLAYAWEGARVRDLDADARTRLRDRASQAGLCSASDDAPARVLPPAGRPVTVPAPSRARRVNRTTGAVEPIEPGSPLSTDPDPESTSPGPATRVPFRPPTWSDTLCSEAETRLWNDPEAEPARRYLLSGLGQGPGGADGRALPEAAARKFKLGALLHDGWWWVVLPILDPRTGDAVNAKLRRVPSDVDGSCPKPKYTAFAGRPLTLFGARSLGHDFLEPVAVVEGEFDVIALWAYGYQRSAVSGTSGAGSFDDAWLDQLEPYQAFVLAYDVEQSGTGEKGAEGLADKLGRYRCARVRLPYKDASECWLRGVPAAQIEHAIEDARPYVGMEVHKPGHWASAIEDKVANPERVYGLPTGSKVLDELIAGWPRGVTVITGPTKAGKSSLTSWLLYEQAQLGVPVLATGFENGIDETIERWLCMRLGGDFMQVTAADRARAFAANDRAPLFAVGHYGPAKLDDLIETMRYYKRRHGVRVVSVDHLGFLVNLADHRISEMQQTQHAMRTLVTVARDEGLSVLALAHPTGQPEREQRRVRIADIKNTSSVAQDCALGLSLERDPKTPRPGIAVHCDIMRGRYARGSGSRGWLWYDPIAYCYADEFDRLPNAAQIDASRGSG